MGSISIWHLLILLALVLIPIAAVIAGIVTAKRARSPSGEPQGFGGWLLYLAIMVGVAPAVSFLGSIMQFEHYPQVWQLPGGHVVVSIEVLMNASMFVLSVHLARTMWRRSYTFPMLFGFVWVVGCGVLLLDGLLVMIGSDVPREQVFTATYLRSIGLAFIGGGLWYWYLSKSVRVRNTFTRGSPDLGERWSRFLRQGANPIYSPCEGIAGLGRRGRAAWWHPIGAV